MDYNPIYQKFTLEAKYKMAQNNYGITRGDFEDHLDENGACMTRLFHTEYEL